MPQGSETGLAVEVLLREEEIARQFASALERRHLDEQFFYWLPLSVQAWVELCRGSEYRNANRALKLVAKTAPALAGLWPQADALVSIGCGEGSKDRPLLEAFAARGARLVYVAADFSQGLLELALASNRDVAREVRGVKLDVFCDHHLPALVPGGRGAIYAVLGNTLGAFDAAQFPARLRRLLRPEDRVLFDGELFAGEETLRGYDNPVNRRFAFAPLAGIGLGDADGELRFELRPGTNGLHAVTKYFVAARHLEVHAGGRSILIAAGEKLRMSSSIKYDRRAFEELIASGGFRIERMEASDDARFLLAAAAPV
ncbi:MAG: L-histidine N(alpha)-methyltransferase [Terriglobales bacterium]